MNICSHKQDAQLIVYDADRLQDPDVRLFDPTYWRQLSALSGEATGRGSAWFIDAPFGPSVLREYLRGGLPGRFIRARYGFTGWSKTRPVAEFHMLEKLFEAGLPVPAPIAALVRRHGATYSGSLITRRIENTSTLADRIVEQSCHEATWQAAGRCIRVFHEQGLVHADLNARNILLDGEDRVYLIDLDRARIAPGKASAFRRNLARLRRSLEKLRPATAPGALDQGWNVLLEAYRDAGETREAG